MIKQDKLSTSDHILFVIGIISVTLIATLLANNFFKGHAGLLITEIILYIGCGYVYPSLLIARLLALYSAVLLHRNLSFNP